MTELPGDFLLELASWHADRDALERVRRLVFIEEQGFTDEEEWDDQEEQSLHALATTMNGDPIGTARLTPDGQFGRLAVLPAWRGAGVGHALVRMLLDAARARGDKRVVLGAQSSATGFYERLGFVAGAASYVEGGIEHIRMQVDLEPAQLSAGPRIEVADRISAGVQDDGQRLESIEELTACYIQLIAAARRTVDFYTRDLEPRALDRGEIMRELTALATSGRGRRIRFLVEDTAPALERSHRLIDLSQRLSTAISIRVPAKMHRGYVGAYVVADGRHVVHRDQATMIEGQWMPNRPRKARQLLSHFDEVWEHGAPDPHFRYLGL